MGVLGAALLVGATAYVAYAEYKNEMKHARENIAILTEVIGNNTLAAFAAIDQGLEHAAQDFAEKSSAGPIAETDGHRFLLGTKQGLPFVRGIGWFDRDGNRVSSSFGLGRPALNIAGEPNFDIHRESGQSTLFVAPPIKAISLPGEWIVAVSRKVAGADGAFIGVVNAVLDVRAIANNYSDIALKSGIAFALFHENGAMIFRVPEVEGAMGRDMRSAPLFTRELVQAESGVTIARSPFRQVEVVRGFRKLPGLPIVVAVARPVSDVLDEWRTRQYANLVFVLAFIVAIGIGSAILLLQYRHILRRQSELAAAKAQAEASNRAKSAFLANMSHELRTPLNAIIGFGEIVAGQALGPVGVPRYVEYAEDIVGSGRHLLQVINDVLDLSRIEANRLELHLESLRLKPVIEACLVMVREKAREGGIAMDVRLEDVPPILADELRIKQSVINVLGNAVKFTPRGGRISVRLGRSSQEWIDIVVEDTGVGMSPDELKLALQPFGQVQTYLTKQTDGVGLGLPITCRFVELHGGTFAIEGAKGKGIKVTIRLPAVPANRTGGEDR